MCKRINGKSKRTAVTLMLNFFSLCPFLSSVLFSFIPSFSHFQIFLVLFRSSLITPYFLFSLFGVLLFGVLSLHLSLFNSLLTPWLLSSLFIEREEGRSPSQKKLRTQFKAKFPSQLISSRFLSFFFRLSFPFYFPFFLFALSLCFHSAINFLHLSLFNFLLASFILSSVFIENINNRF